METPIGFTLRTISNLMRRRLDSSEVLRECEKITGMHGFVIGFIYHHGSEVFQKEIEKELRIRRSTATEILKLMEANGLIERTSVEYDLRLKKIKLTPKAISLHKEIEKEIAAVEAEMTGGLTEGEIAEFTRIADKIKRNLE